MIIMAGGGGGGGGGGRDSNPRPGALQGNTLQHARTGAPTKHNHYQIFKLVSSAAASPFALRSSNPSP